MPTDMRGHARRVQGNRQVKTRASETERPRQRSWRRSDGDSASWVAPQLNFSGVARMIGQTGERRASMDTAELKGLPRRVGLMTYEQVRALLEGNRQQIQVHNKMERRRDSCPQCVWHVQHRYAHCAYQDALLYAYRALSGRDPNAEAAILSITRHQAACPT